MTFKKKVIIKTIVIIVLFLLIGWMILYFIIARLTVPRFPEENLKKALELMEDESYIGMSFEECEEIFGDSGKESPGQCVCYSVGTFQWMGQCDYELHIFFDQEEKVKAIRLIEEEEW